MKDIKIFKATELKDIREIVYNSVKLYGEQVAYVIKHKENKDVIYENITYKKLLEDINKLGTTFLIWDFKKRELL